MPGNDLNIYGELNLMREATRSVLERSRMERDRIADLLDALEQAPCCVWDNSVRENGCGGGRRGGPPAPRHLIAWG